MFGFRRSGHKCFNLFNLVESIPITFQPRWRCKWRLNPASLRNMMHSLLALVDSHTYLYHFSIVNRVLRPTGVISRVFYSDVISLQCSWIILMLMESMLEKMLSIICCRIFLMVYHFCNIHNFLTIFLALLSFAFVRLAWQWIHSV